VVGLSYFGYVSSVLAPPAVCLLLNDDALRKRDCESCDKGAKDARRAFLRGATWLFKKAPK
jgi:histidinol phosphatase-like PHP family hydrolase